MWLFPLKHEYTGNADGLGTLRLLEAVRFRIRK
jgi:GDP-D-mannose dehydratase